MWNIFIMKDFGKIQFLHVAQMQLFETEKKKSTGKKMGRKFNRTYL